MRPEDIDSAFRPRPRATIAAEDVDGVVVLYDELYGTCHELNASASAIWTSFDGTRTVAEIVDELSLRYATERSTVEDDVLALLHHLGDLRVLDGVTSRAEDELSGGQAAT